MNICKEIPLSELQRIEGGGRPLYYGANGYLSRDQYDHFHYTVTKGPLKATLGVIANGWANTLGGVSWSPRANW